MYIKILIICQMFYLCIFKQVQNDLFIIIIIIIIYYYYYYYFVGLDQHCKLIVMPDYRFLTIHAHLTDIK